ncbi:hypothetical protein [Alkalihalophilus marmarensis]|uniref:hypothetical protein n=1 Tax=Alkalihalophilus marmarensis TaxID=521377 RepID=UPI002E2290F8|nr:hypothetical protein [Alkalihalophilus marmarensis]
MGKSIYFTNKELSWLHNVADLTDNETNNINEDVSEEDAIQESVVYKLANTIRK